MTMFLLFPKKIEIRTSMTPKQCREKISGEIREKRKKSGLIAASAFVKEHRFDSCYYGEWDKSGELKLFYHKAKKHDGTSAGFYGRIEKTDGGSVIRGRIRKAVPAVVFSCIFILLSVVLILALVSLKEYKGAICTAAVFLVGLWFMIYDSSESYIKTYLKTFEEDKKK